MAENSENIPPQPTTPTSKAPLAQGFASGSNMEYVNTRNDTTPFRNSIKAHQMQHDSDDDTTDAHYLKLAARLNGYVRGEGFEGILGGLGLSNVFNQFSATIDDKFDSLVEETSIISGGKITHYGRNPVKYLESEVMVSFRTMYKAMKDRSADLDESIQINDRYRLEDHQNRPLAGSQHKPDAVLFYDREYENAWPHAHIIIKAKLTSKMRPEGKVLGQIATYAHEVWKNQPTRTFVPVLYLNGQQITLLIFTRSGCYYGILGDFIRVSSLGPGYYNTRNVQRTIKRLWFLITLRPDCFGHYVNVTQDCQFLKFVRGNSVRSLGTSVDATVDIVDASDPDAVSLRDKIERKVEIVGRLGYLFNTKFRGSDAVLKLSWTRVDSMPEGAIYEHLHENKVTGVPQVYASGILVRDLFGYRLEFIILEYCGYDLNRYMTGECQRQHDRTFRRTITSVITKTFACLLHAKHVGVLHRDISAGNITVCDGKIFVIDWGYAKLIATNTGDTSHMDALAERWGFSKKTVQATENERDANIGTRVYMGIRIHSQCPQRDIMDDLESLFYVVLHTLACRENKKLVEFLGCNRQPNDVAARLKVGSMSSPDFYLKSAGIERCPGGIKAVLDRLHERLFFVDGKCIGLNLVYDDEEMDSRRELDDKFVTNIIGDVAFKEIFGCMPDLSVPQPSTATPLPMDDKVITDTLTATLVLSKSTSISRKQTADDDAGSASPKRRRY